MTNQKLARLPVRPMVAGLPASAVSPSEESLAAMAAPRLLLLRALALGGLVLLVGWGGSGAEGQKKKEVSGSRGLR